MTFCRRAVCLALLSFMFIHPSFAASDLELEKRFAEALRPDEGDVRQERAGKAIQGYQAANILPFKPMRADFNDYYVVQRPTSFMGNQLVVVMEEYMLAYIGCCVDPGASVYVRLTGGIAPIAAFARANKCRIEEYPDRNTFLRALPVAVNVEPGRYASLHCHASDMSD